MKSIMFCLLVLLMGVSAQAQSSYQWGFPGESSSPPVSVTVTTAPAYKPVSPGSGVSYDLIDFGANYPKPTPITVAPSQATLYRQMPGTSVISPIPVSFFRTQGNFIYRYEIIEGVPSPFPTAIIQLH